MAENDQKTWWRLETRNDNRHAMVELASRTRRSLAVFSHDLDPGVLDDPAFLEHVRNLATGSRYAQVRILLIDPTRAIREGHRLLEVARRLSSFVEIRKPFKDYEDLSEAFAIADESGIIYRKLGTRWEGVADTHDPVMARDKLKLFNEIWQRSHQESETRRLGI